MNITNNIDSAIETLISKVGKNIVLATPLAIGKANHIINALYKKAKNDSSINLTIYTALTLQKPKPQSDLEHRFLDPILERVFKNYPDLEYETDRLNNSLPKNINVIEFYYRAGQYKKNAYGQKNYLSSNYTHVVRDIFHRGVNVICQQVSKSYLNGDEVYSLSSNPDTSLDLVELLKKSERPFVSIAQVNQDLPFMFGESIVSKNYFDIVVDNRALDFANFSPPKMSVSEADYLIGLHCSHLIKDDGEIQIGIGSLGDALVYSLGLRQNNNELYKVILNQFKIDSNSFPILDSWGESKAFTKGLFAATEMLVDSFSELYKKKILKKKVYDSIVIQRLLNQDRIKEHFDKSIFIELYKEKTIQSVLSHKDYLFLKEYGIIKSEVHWENNQLSLPTGEMLVPNIFEIDLEKIMGDKLRNGAIAHAGFFVGPRAFYDFLKDLPIPERKLFRMKRISQINHLFGHEEIDRLQRINGRFLNTCMKVTLNGSANSDALENGAQISGVGGQYNFVAMAQALPDARSILKLRSTRINSKGKLISNIVFNYANCTIPRHLRDIVVTEYGIADLRGKTDEEVAIELIQIADSRFQNTLIKQAKKAKKIKNNFVLSTRFNENFPKNYLDKFRELKCQGIFPLFPLGTDFTETEIKLAKGLKKIKALKRKKVQFIFFLIKSLFFVKIKKNNLIYLKRMQLEKPINFKTFIYQKLVNSSLIE